MVICLNIGQFIFSFVTPNSSFSISYSSYPIPPFHSQFLFPIPHPHSPPPFLIFLLAGYLFMPFI